MSWNIFLGVLAGLSQLGNAFMGWKVTGKQLTPKQQKWYDGLFIGVGLVGVLSIALLAARSGRQERAHFAVRMGNAIEQKLPDNSLVPFSWFMVDKPLAFNVFRKNVGNGSAYNVSEYLRSFIKADTSVDSQREAIYEFKAWVASRPRQVVGFTVAKDEQERWNTAFGEILTPEDRDNLINGRKVVFVLDVITFSDDFGSHEFDLCNMLEKQQALPPSFQGQTAVQEIWHFCNDYNGEH